MGLYTDINEKNHRNLLRMVWLTIALLAAGLFCLGNAHAQTGTPQTKTQLNTEQDTNFADNSAGLITPLAMRQTMIDFIVSWQQAARLNAQTGGTYLVTVDDYGKLVTHSNGSAVAVTLPQATTTFAVFNYYTCNINTGAVTITPTTSTINGASTLVLQNGQCTQIISDGTNYQLANLSIAPSTCAAGNFATGITANRTLSCATPATTVNATSFYNCSLQSFGALGSLTVNVNDAGGATPTPGSPCIIPFNGGVGNLTILTINSSLTLSTPGSGATLGTSNNTAFRFWVEIFNDGGTPRIGLYNATNTSGECQSLEEGLTASSTILNGSSTASQTFYTNTGVSTRFFRVMGYIEYNSTGLTTAGTYNTSPAFIVGYTQGVHLPCTILQSRVGTNSTNTTTTSSSFVNTNLTKNITPTGAANYIKVMATGQCSSSVAAILCSTAIRRSSTTIGSVATVASATTNTKASSLMLGQEIVPNTLSTITYTVGVHNSDNASSVNFNSNTDPQVIIVEEYQG